MSRRALALTAVTSLVGCAHTPAAPAASAPSAECSTRELEDALAGAPSAPVIVLLQDEREGLDARRTRLLETLGPDFQLTRSYQNLPGFAGSITRRGYERARADQAVRCIQLDHPGSGG